MTLASRWKPIPVLASILAGLILALLVMIGVVVYHLRQAVVFNPAGWLTVRDIGSKETDPLTRAYIAKVGLFANAKTEALYLQAVIGDHISLAGILRGQPIQRLQGGTHYRLHVDRPIPAAWWSVTLYGADEFLVPNPEKRYAFLSHELIPNSNGQIVIDVAPSRPQDARYWLPSPNAGPIALNLRIYNPKRDVYEHIDTFPLPRIEVVEKN